MPNNDFRSRWTTENEIEYIHSLPGFRYLKTPNGKFRQPTITEKQLLENFIRSAKKRKAWGTYGSVDPDVVIAEAERILSHL